MAKHALANLREIDCVRWYRGLSDEQIKACNKLLYALRDDTEQGTTYRVRRCFTQLGLHPPIPSERIKAIMKISHCNDLAFLWFIWEAEYKRPQDKSTIIDIENEPYTVNEQLLYSAMAHLDMEATMRALDDILPPPSHSKKFMNDKIQNNRGKKQIPKKQQKQQKPTQSISPYFARLVRPKQFIPKTTARPKLQKLHFPEYSQHKNPMYEIPNERSRWFSHYKLSPGKRIIKKFLSEELDRLFFGASSLFSEPSIEGNPLCSTHEAMKEELALKQKKLTHETLNKVLAHVDFTDTAQKEERRKRIRESLEREIQCAADKLHQFSLRQVTQLTLLRSDNIDADCRLCHYLVSSPAQKKGRQADLALIMNTDAEQVSHPMPPDKERSPFVKVSQLKGEGQRHSCCKTDGCVMVDTKTLKGNQEIINQSNLIRRSLGGGGGGGAKKGSRHKKRYIFQKKKDSLELKRKTNDFQNLQDLIPLCGHWQKCVHRGVPLDHTESYTTKSKYGIHFDYFKIFDPPKLPPLSELEAECETGEFRMDIEDKEPLIKQCCLDALNKTLNDQDEIEKWNNIEIPKYTPPPPSVRSAIDKCAQNVFKVESAIGKTKEGFAFQISADRTNLLKVTNIDPDDRNQMIELLKSGLKILRRNPSYVLATFCNAHKLPILVDWVADRYGKTYNQKEMNQIINSSFKVYEQLDSTSIPVRNLLPIVGGLANFGDREQIINYIECFKTKFLQDLKEKELEHSRLIWLALRGYSHLSGYIGNTFFAYMPCRETDLKLCNLWNHRDYRDMVDIRVTLSHRKSQK